MTTAGWRRSAEERLARQAAMEEEEGKELILEPVEEPKKPGRKEIPPSFSCGIEG